MSRLKVAVALCTYNGAGYLRQQLASLAVQTRPIDELVVRDDGSSDGTQEILAEFAARAGMHVRILPSVERLGATRNFECAARAADADVILFCDQDDIWAADKVEVVTSVLRKDSAVSCVISDAAAIDEYGRELGMTLWRSAGFVPRSRALTPACFQRALLRRTIAFGNVMAIRSNILRYALPVAMPFGHDSWTALFAAAISRIALVGRPLTFYRQHARQASGGLGRRSVSGTWAGSKLGAQSPTAESFAALAQRLEGYAGVAVDSSAHQTVVAELRAKAAHLRFRASVPPSVRERFAAVAFEFARLRYHHYSNGCWSAGQDLIRGARKEFAP